MAYQVTQLNDLEQDGILFTEFLLIDDQGIMPEMRLQKVFRLGDNLETIIANQKIIDALFYENEYLNNH